MREVSEVTLTYVVPTLAIITILENIVEVYTILASKETKKPLGISIILLLNLSLSDLFVGIGLLVYVLIKHLSSSVITDEYLIFMRLFLLRFTLIFSSFSIITLTLTRMFAVTKPIAYRKTKRSFAIKLAVIIWLSSLILSSVCYGFIRFYKTNSLNYYGNFLFPIISYPTIMLCCICFYKIIKTIQRQRRFRLEHSRYYTSKKPSSIDIKTIDKEKKKHSGLKSISFRKSMKTETDGIKDKFNKIYEMQLLKLTGGTIVVFIICWLPISTVMLLRLYSKIENSQYSSDIEMSISQIAHFNSLLNPIIYFIYTRACIKTPIARHISSTLRRMKSSQ